MSATQQAVRISGREFVMEGDGSDPYFSNLSAAVAGLSGLETWARANLRPDAVVIDAGGNIGVSALMLATLVPRGQVHVFEALPANAAYLRRNLALNAIGNCTVNAVALGRRPGVAHMGGSGAGAFIEPGATTTEGVPITSLDLYAAALGRVDFIKIDVEGSEPAVLAGAAATIERFRPAIYLEFNSWCLAFHQGYSTRDFAGRLWQAFEVCLLEAGAREVPAGDVTSFLHDNAVLHSAVTDILLRLKDDARVPDLAEPTYLPADPVTAERLRVAELTLDAIRRSTSWRVTAPLRAVARVLGR